MGLSMGENVSSKKKRERMEKTELNLQLSMPSLYSLSGTLLVHIQTAKTQIQRWGDQEDKHGFLVMGKSRPQFHKELGLPMLLSAHICTHQNKMLTNDPIIQQHCQYKGSSR
jgi:hypothetical protein